MSTLILAGCDINKRTLSNVSPVYQTACKGDTKILPLLLEAGADYLNDEGFGTTPYEIARGWGEEGTLNVLARFTEQKALSFAMGEHERVGGYSLIRHLPCDLISLIIEDLVN